MKLMKKAMAAMLSSILVIGMSMTVYAEMGGYLTTPANLGEGAYPGRVSGTWEERSDGWYYVKPDGTDLMNGFVDGYYLSWTGRMIENCSREANMMIYNTVYGGQDPHTYSVDSWVSGASDYQDIWRMRSKDSNGIWKYSGNVGNEEKVSAKECCDVTFSWIDSVAQEAIKLPETERVKYLANKVADKVEYQWPSEEDDDTIPLKNTDPFSAASTCYYGTGVCQGYATLFKHLCQHSGLECVMVVGTTTAGHAWNKVAADGTSYFVDVTFYDTGDCDPKYMMSAELWPDHVLEEYNDIEL